MINATKLRFYKHLSQAAGQFSPRDLFREFVAMVACSLSMGWREDEYLQSVRHLKAPEITACVEAFGLLVDEMEAHPYEDLLGPVWMDLSAGTRNWSGEFYTPRDVCTASARTMLGEDLPEDRPLTILEPTCGSGNMILAVVEVLAEQKVPPNRIWVEARDLSKTACDMTYINMSLYGVPGEIVHGNTLSMQEISRWPTRFRAFSAGHQFVQESIKALGSISAPAEKAIEKGEHDEPVSHQPIGSNLRLF